MKNTFILYTSFYEPIKSFSDAELGQLMRLIFEYQINPDNPVGFSVNSGVKMAFEFFKNQFKVDDEKYQKIILRNQANGQKGGRPRKYEETQVNPQNPVGLKKPKKAVNDNENDNENVIKYTKKYFKTNWEQILKEIKEEYKDSPEYKNKDFDGVMKEFLMKIDIKNYGYTNYRLAYLNWVRNSYNSGVKSNGAVKSDKSKYGGR